MAVPTSEVAQGIFQIGPIKTGTVSRPTAPFVVVGKERAMLIDPGEEGQAPGLLEGVSQCGVDPGRIAYIWVSHIHMHHTQGVPLLLEKLPKATLLVHPAGAPHMIEPSRFVQSTLQVFGPNCYGPFRAIPKERVMAVDDGQVFDLGGRELQNLWAPGHAPHHQILFDRLTKALFMGDLGAPGEGSFGAPGGNSPTRFFMDMHVESLRRAADLKPSMLLIFGHQGIIPEDPQQALTDIAVDFQAVLRVCLVGMREKVTLPEIDRRVEALRQLVKYKHWEAPTEVPGPQGRREIGAPPHFMAYLRRKYPDLELPSGPRQKTSKAMKERLGTPLDYVGTDTRRLAPED